MRIKVFKHSLQLPIVLLGLIEAALLIGSVYLGAWVRFPDNVGIVGPIYTRPLVFAIIVLTSMVAMGMYQTRTRTDRLGALIRLGASFVLSAVALAALFYAAPTLYLGRGALLITYIAGFVALGIVRLVFYSMVGDTFFRPRVLVYGAGEKAANLINLTGTLAERQSNVIGFVKSSGDIATRVAAADVISLSGRLSTYATANNVDEIVVAIDDRRKGLPVQELLECKLNGIAVSDALNYFERETGKVKLDLLYPSWMIFSEGFAAGNRLEAALGRILDLIASMALLLATWPLMALVAVAIVLEDGFPVFYRQPRVGYKGEIFNVLKFRSMRVDAESDGVARWAQPDDDRVTRVGRVIRKFRIDELPQIINVLRGEMRFVGPRPERPDFVDQLSQRIPYYRERHCVKPGITGWAQLRYEYGASQEDALEKLQYDLYYVKNRSLLLDILILLQTAEVVLWRTGAR